MLTSERNLNSQSKIWQIFDGLNQGFGGVANTIKKFGIVAAGLSVAAGAKQFVSTSPVAYRSNTSADGVAHWVNRAANKVLVNFCNQVLVSQSFPDASSGLYINGLWAHGTTGYTRL